MRGYGYDQLDVVMSCDRRLFRDSLCQISNWIQQFAICSNLFFVPEAWASTAQPPLVQRDRKKWNFPRFAHCKRSVQFAASSSGARVFLHRPDTLQEFERKRLHAHTHKWPQTTETSTHTQPGSELHPFYRHSHTNTVFSSALSLLQSVLLYDVRGQEMQSVRTVIQTRSGFPG